MYANKSYLINVDLPRLYWHPKCKKLENTLRVLRQTTVLLQLG